VLAWTKEVAPVVVYTTGAMVVEIGRRARDTTANATGSVI